MAGMACPISATVIRVGNRVTHPTLEAYDSLCHFDDRLLIGEFVTATVADDCRWEYPEELQIGP